MPVDDLGTPSPRKGSICYEKETDRFSICYDRNDSVPQQNRKTEESLACRLFLGLTLARPRSGSP